MISHDPNNSFAFIDQHIIVPSQNLGFIPLFKLYWILMEIGWEKRALSALINNVIDIYNEIQLNASFHT